ncbi:hypothetical protein [Arthrobacter sp. SAFR-044]|uniref:hypothetical protein n=1 Tax=Arthrobacter sp. SAFR-044 TaxID=3387278 RepID=UPI003F7C14F7
MDDELLVAPAATIKKIANRTGVHENFLGKHVPLPLGHEVGERRDYTAGVDALFRVDAPRGRQTPGHRWYRLMDLDRAGIYWRLDPRLSEDQQTGVGLLPATTSSNDVEADGARQERV